MNGFTPAWESLSGHRCPEWFRDAKFGIWAHWGPQAVPEYGDWYGRFIYNAPVPVAGDWERGQFGDRFAAFHREHYGHPSKFGMKDICNLWKADLWEPDELMRLYKRTGATYFAGLACHHDNLDCWNSRHHRWNSVNVGPKKDILGMWARAARQNGLRFGTTVHNARTWSWYEPSRGADEDGPLKGIPYDGNLTKADGKGTWWEGLDPQEIYCKPHPPGVPPDQEYIDDYYNRVMDLVEQHDPDFLYFDDDMPPFGDTGLRIAANYLNLNAKRRNGRCEGIINVKKVPYEYRNAVVMDMEKGQSDRLEPWPWQSETCIGNWFYVKGMGYKPASQIITTLADIVSKNGNFLLSVPLRGNGTHDEEELKILDEIGAWMRMNGEAIYSTRPWKVFGEGPTKNEAGHFKEKQVIYTSQDFRFTSTRDALYAIGLAKPSDNKAIISSFSKKSGHFEGRMNRVTLLGSGDKPLAWKLTDEGLSVTLPVEVPGDIGYVLKIV